VRDVGALRRLRGERRARRHGHFPDRDSHHYERRDHDGADDHNHGPRTNGPDDRTGDVPDDPDNAAYRANDTHHRAEGHAHHRLHSPDDRAGHDDDDLRVDAVRPGDLLLVP
jgi:hypothetical protein